MDTQMSETPQAAPSTADSLSASGGAPLAYSIDRFCKRSGLGRSFVYAAIKAGELQARKAGRRTLILHDEGERYLRSLPSIRTAP